MNGAMLFVKLSDCEFLGNMKLNEIFIGLRANHSGV